MGHEHRAGRAPCRGAAFPHSLPAAPGSRSSRVIQSRPPNVLKHIHLPDLLGIWVWSKAGGCCTILPNKTHEALLDLFLERAGDWLGNRLKNPPTLSAFQRVSPALALTAQPCLQRVPGIRRCRARHNVKRGSHSPFYK